MANPTLSVRTPLDGLAHSFGETSLTEIADLALVAIATPLGNEAAMTKAVGASYKTAVPAAGRSVVSKATDTRLVGLQQDQFFVAFTHKKPDAESAIPAAIQKVGYVTDQSDAWVKLRLSGPLARTALERICPIDLHVDAFAIGDVARTTMEHLGAVVLREDKDTYVLMSASSSAHSFAHAIETSIRNVMD